MDCFGYKVNFSNEANPKVSPNVPKTIVDKVKKRLEDVSLDCSQRFKRTSERHKHATFNRRPVSFPVFDKKILDEMEMIKEKDHPQIFFDTGLKYRRLYEDTARLLYLQMSYTLFCIAIYGTECPDLRNRGIKLGQYIYNSFVYGPDFSKFLKRLRNISCIDSFKTDDTGLTIQYKERYENIKVEAKKYFPSFDIKDRNHSYDGYLNEGFLIHFHEESNDFPWAFKEVNTDEDTVDEFRLNLRTLLDRYPADIGCDTSKECTWASDSKNTFLGAPSDRKVNRKIVRETKSHGKLTEDFVFTRASIPVGPANVRDSWIPDLDTLFTIKSISRDTRDILENVPFSAMASAKKAIARKRRITKLRDYPCIMIDFKKAGITIPRYIFRIVSEELERKYPQVESFKYIRHFEKAIVYDGKTPHVPERGSGLGNANEIYTLIQCVIALGITECDPNNDAIIYNDDGVWAINSSYEIGFNSLVEIFEDLGFILNLKKSFVSEFNVFCEEYYHEEYYWGKKQLYFTPIANLLLQPTISYAKKFYHNYKMSFIGNEFDLDIESVLVKLYGFEYHKFEKYLPSQIGGWRFINDSSLNKVLHWMGEKCTRYYLSPSGISLTNLAKSFLRYIVYNNKNLDNFICTKIPYKTEVLPFKIDKGRELFYKVSKDLVEGLRINHPNDLYNQSYEVLNYRGLKNARPHMKYGLARKEEFLRIKFFRRFMGVSSAYRPLFHESEMIHAARVLAKSLNNKNFAIPEKFIIGNASFKYRTTRSVVETDGIIKRKNIPEPYYIYDRNYIRLLSESKRSRRILPGLDIFAGIHEYASSKSSVFRSNSEIIIPVNKSLGAIPSILNLFGKNRLIVAIDAYTRHQFPVEFKAMGHKFMRGEIDLLVDTLAEVFPSEKKLIRGSIKSFSKLQNEILQRYTVENGISNLGELKKMLNFIANNVCEPEKDQEHKFSKTGRLGLRRITYNRLYGYPSIDALLEQSDEWSDYVPTPEESEEDYYSEHDDFRHDEGYYLENEFPTSRDMKLYGD